MVLDASAQKVWEAALGRLQVQVTRPSYDTWLRDTVGLTLDGQRLVVGTPTTFAAAWLEQRMSHLIDTAVSAVAREQMEVAFEVRPAAGQPTGGQQQDTMALSTAPAPKAAPPPPRDAPPALNYRYTFDSFIVGASNQLAHAAALAISDRPGHSYNPLFIYAPVGLGKTHLLHAIAHRVRQSGKRAHYVSAEQFTNEFIDAIRDRKTSEFRNRYRQPDVLLLDDIQFISGKEQTQEGFFHTFNALHNSNRQIVITCDRPPGGLPLLEDRLRSRFEWGLVADMQHPDEETRLAILRHRAADSPVPVPEAVLSLAAGPQGTNIRELEGRLNRVTAMASFTNQPLTLELAEQVLSTSGSGEPKGGRPTPQAVIDAVAQHHDLPPGVITGPRRDKQAVAARQLAMYLLSQSLKLSPEEVGLAVGGRDRTTAIYAIRKFCRHLEADSALQATSVAIMAQLRTP